MNDSKAAAQLLSGFYSVENNSWRWTAGKFSVRLRTPPGAAQSGAALSFSFTIPDATIQKLKSLALSASINGMALKSATYNAPGANVFSADIPAPMLAAESVTVDFALANSVGLSGK
jgi:hypothetical protein